MRMLRSLLADRRATAGLIILTLLGFTALLAPALAPADPVAQEDILRSRFLTPFAEGPSGIVHILGTDRFGRDVLSRLLYGARISLSVGILAVVLSVGVGLGVGVAAGFLGGKTEQALMTITDGALAMPRLVLLLALVALWEPSLVLVVLVLGFTGWMGIARLVRVEVKRVMAEQYVAAAYAAGVGSWQLVRRHLIPNAITPVFAAAALGVGNAIGLEAGLSFLGLGIPPPAPSWGSMIASGRDALVNAPWVATFPGLAIVLAIVACNLLGDGARDALDPRTRRMGATEKG